jgi:hypothetical protein
MINGVILIKELDWIIRRFNREGFYSIIIQIMTEIKREYKDFFRIENSEGVIFSIIKFNISSREMP